MMVWGKMLGWFNLTLLGVVSYASAAISMQMLEQGLISATPPPAAAAKARSTATRKARMPLSVFQPILDANIFRAKRREKPLGPPQPVVPGAVATPVAAPSVALDVELKGTVIAGKTSFALIAQPGGRDEKIYRRRECVPAGEKHPSKTCAPNQGKLRTIRKNYIVVIYQGQKLVIKLTDKSTPKSRPSTARRPAPRRTGAAKKSNPKGGLFPITRNGNEMEVRVPQAEVAQAFENFSDVLKQARVVPYTGDGFTGFQIRSIRAGSIFQRIGLQNFDVIKAVNGQAITTADQALRLLTMFRNEKQILLDLHRRNESLKLNYLIE